MRAQQPIKRRHRFWRKLFFILLFGMVGLFLAASRQPDEFRVTRSITIAAPASTVFLHVNSPKRFNEWNPWAKIDPQAKTEIEGPVEGVGSVMRWDGNAEVGKGRMTNVVVKKDQFIQFRMDFEKPMKSTQTAEFSFASVDGGTKVTWTMYGKANLLSKVMNVLFDCEKMVGDQFDKGLQQLKEIVEHSYA